MLNTDGVVDSIAGERVADLALVSQNLVLPRCALQGTNKAPAKSRANDLAANPQTCDRAPLEPGSSA
jgi:hypothetical protein